jgi:topoisomerase-4 subunit A
MIEKYFPKQVLSCIYFDGESKAYFTKRFTPENTTTKTLIITEHENSRIELITGQVSPVVEIKFGKEKDKEIPDEELNLVEFSPMVNMKAKGKKLTSYKVKDISLQVPQEIQDAQEFLDGDDSGLSPMELHRRAMEKISKSSAQDFMSGDGQIGISFD